MKRNLFLCFVFGASVLLSACGAFAPYVDARREAGTLMTVGKSTPEKVSICYNSSASSPEEVLSLATAECAKTGKKPKFLGQNYWDCSLFVPTRVEYRCE